MSFATKQKDSIEQIKVLSESAAKSKKKSKSSETPHLLAVNEQDQSVLEAFKNSLWLRNLKTKEIVWVVAGAHQSDITAVSFIDNSTVVSAGKSEVSVWNTPDNEQPVNMLDVPSLEGNPVQRLSVFPNKDKKTIIACVSIQEVSLYAVSKTSQKVLSPYSRVQLDSHSSDTFVQVFGTNATNQGDSSGKKSKSKGETTSFAIDAIYGSVFNLQKKRLSVSEGVVQIESDYVNGADSLKNKKSKNDEEYQVAGLGDEEMPVNSGKGLRLLPTDASSLDTLESKMT